MAISHISHLHHVAGRRTFGAAHPGCLGAHPGQLRLGAPWPTPPRRTLANSASAHPGHLRLSTLANSASAHPGRLGATPAAVACTPGAAAAPNGGAVARISSPRARHGA
eukprot:6599436-Prymnesium_polylepis.1